MSSQTYEFLIKILDKKIEHLQKAIQYIEASNEDDAMKMINKIGKMIEKVEKRKSALLNSETSKENER